MIKKIRDKLKSNEFVAGLIDDYDYRTTVFSAVSFLITVGFAVMNLVSAIIYRLFWYGAIAGYYIVLVLFRGSVLVSNRKCARRCSENADKYEACKWKIYSGSGAFLLFVELAMIGAITQMMLYGRPTLLGGQIMAIATATYTFFKIIMAIINLVNARKSHNPVTQSLRNLNFADALMSVVSLTVIMISAFDSVPPTDSMQYLKFAIGLAVCLGVIAMSVAMIIVANKNLRMLKEQNKDE